MADKAGFVDAEGILWKATQPNKFTDTFGESKGLYNTLVVSAKKFGSKPASGFREIAQTTTEGKFEKLTMAKEFKWVTYAEYFKKVEAFGAGVKKAIPTLAAKDTVVIYAETQQAWMMVAYGLWRQGHVVGTIYATLGEEGALFGINQSRAKAVVADSKLLKIMGKIASQLKYLKDVISISDPPADAAEALKSAGITIHNMDDLLAVGLKEPCEATPLEGEDTAVLMYTSGTTGNPKGVLISHKAVISTIAGTASKSSALGLDGKSFFHSETVFLAYLPLAHILELTVEIAMFAVGAKVGYGSPGTLTSSGVKMLQTTPPQVGDAELLSPTVFVAAPAVLDKVLIGVKAKFAATSPFIQGRIQAALDSGYERFNEGGVGAHWTYLVGGTLAFKKAQKMLGGRVELMVTGSAPLGVEVQKYVQTVFNCRVRQGYGLTETCAATCMARAEDNATSNVGPPQESACILLRDWPEGGYTNADKDGEIGMRRGEILIGGPTLCDGYLVDPDEPDPDIVAKNAEDFVTINGRRYFCTGDVGQFTKQGNLMIVDRKKDLVKLQMGEYVALSKVENALKSSKYTAMPMCYATSSMSYAIALICPNISDLQKLAAELGETGTLQELCVNEKVVNGVLKDVQSACSAAKLAKFEIPTKIILIDDLWTPENDMLTAVQKLKRRDICAKHKELIDKAYV